MSQAMWEVDKMLDAYIYDYLLKRKLHASAESFLAEGKVFLDPVAIDAPGGFLLEWWSVFWDIFIARTNEQHSEAATSYIKTQLMKARDLQLQQQDYIQKTQRNPPTANRLVMNDSLNVEIPTTVNKMAANMYVENFALPIRRDVLTNVLPEQRFLKHVSQLPASMFGTSAVDTRPMSQNRTLWDNSESFGTQNQSQQLPGSKNLKGGMKSVLNSRVRMGEGLAGSNRGTSHLTLKGWPSDANMIVRFVFLSDTSGLLRRPKSSIHFPQTSNQFQLQHPLGVQAPQNLGIPSANVSCIRLGVPFKCQNMNIGKDKQLCEIDVDSLAPIFCPAEMLIKHPVLSQHSQNANHQIQLQDKLTSSGITNTDGYMSNDFQANDQADEDYLMDDGTLDDVKSLPSPSKSDERDKVGLLSDSDKGPTLKEIHLISAGTNKVECCRFSSDGKLLASGGHDKKATVWCTKSFAVKSTLDEHSQWITDLCFSPRTLKVATSSSDRTVKVWDVDNHGDSLRTFIGHSTGVTSLDFHPSKDDLLCSSDINTEIRYWSIKNGSCVGILKGGATQLRFQPNNGRILAAAVGNVVSIIDIETQVCRLKLQGHKNNIHSVCWDPSGGYLASTSDDLAKVWKVDSGTKGDCIHELNCHGNTFRTCVFHPTNTSLLIIGSHESLELWDMAENKTRTLHGHDKQVSALATSNVTGVVASASHDKCIKLWQ